jgi:hypothetical protein
MASEVNRYPVAPGWTIARISFSRDAWVLEDGDFNRMSKTGEKLKFPGNQQLFEAYTPLVYHTLDEAFEIASTHLGFDRAVVPLRTEAT